MAMIEIERHGDVVRLRLASWGSRLAGLHVSAYVTRGVLVDSGFAHARAAVARALDELRPAGAMITHWHEDHAGNVALLAARGIPIAMSADTTLQLRADEHLRVYRRLVWGSPPPLPSVVTGFTHPVLQLVSTPGHSADHHVVWDPERETVFSGDLWLGVRTRVMHEDEDPYRILESLRAVMALAPKRMFDAHRGPVTEPAGALRAKTTWLEETIARIEQKLSGGWSISAIVREVLEGEEAVAYASRGEYARRNLVLAIARKIRGDQIRGTDL